MANIESVVKIMNFHSLLRVEKAKKKAESLFDVETELLDLIKHILFNRNLKLDKRVLKANPRGETINIYLGNDLGFCGNFNSVLSKMSKSSTDTKNIIVGQKIFNTLDNTILQMTKEEFESNFEKIKEIISPIIYDKKLKELNVIYNKYYSVSEIKLETLNLFPMKVESNVEYKEDYAIEADVSEVLTSLVLQYIYYEIKICESNSLASENVMRERTTRESLKKIEEINEEKIKVERKRKKYLSFKKQLGALKKGRKNQW